MKPPHCQRDDEYRLTVPEPRPVEGAGIVWAVVCGVPLLVALVALVAAVWPA